MTDGETTWSYKYNADGLRTVKTNGTTTYKYLYSGSTLVQMQINSNVLSFGYDGSAPTTVTYGGNTYYYVTNLQGDVVSILDGNRTEVVKYTYDAWGNILSTTGTLADTLGQINPLRYRGYVYDQECNLYYLQSRYYDAKVGRFLNPDSYPSTGQGIIGNNMFAYCGNNPVKRVDTEGYLWDLVWDVVSLGFSVAEVIQNPDDPMAWVGLAGDVIDVAVPFVGGAGETVRAVNAGRKISEAADDLHDVKKVAKAVHGNSLDYPGINYGYVLSDKTTGEVVKFGESINPSRRYTRKFLNGENPINKPLEMTVVVSGSKRDIHIWQHVQIDDFYEVVGELPALNKSKW